MALYQRCRLCSEASCSTLPSSTSAAVFFTPAMRRHRQCQRSSRTHSTGGCRVCATSATDASSQREISQLDVSEAVVQPSFRSTPWQAEADDRGSAHAAARILFVSESNVCRSPLAVAAMRALLEGSDLAQLVECESKGTREYSLGEPPEATAVLVASELNLTLPTNFAARQFESERDIVHFDLVLVFDKYTAADVLKEVSVYDTINPEGGYARKVRRLGEFHPALAGGKSGDAQDLDDPLYGNQGGEAELEAVRRCATLVQESCEGLVAFLKRLQSGMPEGSSLGAEVSAAVGDMGPMDWLVPPMLQKKQTQGL